MAQHGIYVRIDVAKARVDVAVRPGGDRCEVSNDQAGIWALVAHMQQLGPVALVLEASGGLELPLVTALAAASLPVVVVNPRQVRDFAKATGRLAKTDSLDAEVLAHFAEAVRPPRRPGSVREAGGMPDARTMGDVSSGTDELTERQPVALIGYINRGRPDASGRPLHYPRRHRCNLPPHPG